MYRDNNGGVIGYRGGGSSDSLYKKINSLIDCPNGFTGLSDEAKSSQYTYTTTEPVTVESRSSGRVYGGDSYGIGEPSYNYSGTTNSTIYVPTTKIGTSYWREYRYECNPSIAITNEEAPLNESSSRDLSSSNLNQSTKSDANTNSSDGFRGIPWGTEYKKFPFIKEMTKMAPFLANGYEDETIAFRRKEDLHIGEADIEKLSYHFWKNKFFSVYASARGYYNYKGILDAVKLKYGSPQKSSGSETRYFAEWTVGDSKILLICLMPDESVTFIITSNSIENEIKGNKARSPRRSSGL
ncbi:MAG: hypothetical protein VKK42_32300 [Lyngbya sp.]|nr:hypothetical protein [Lyngbya sp.]